MTRMNVPDDDDAGTAEAGPAAILSDRLPRAAAAAAQLVGDAPAFLRALSTVPAIAAGDATVLVYGETGTGKELVARAIHYLSARAPYPFVAVNCGALAETLLDDELFGHERGAFTDARSRRAGVIAQADRGTLFLDEVDSLSPRAQVALLRVLQERSYRALGSTREQRVDARFIAASNVPLLPLVRSGTFRADLYYRLCVLSVGLPPLRDRREDIPRLAVHLLRRNLTAGSPEPRFSAAALAAMVSCPWPGNVRELENAVIRGLCLARQGVIEVDDLGLLPGSGLIGFDLPMAAAVPDAPHAEAPTVAAPVTWAPGVPFRALKQRAVETFEREYLVRSLAEHGGNVTQAARSAGKERREFGKLIKKYQLDPRSFLRAR